MSTTTNIILIVIIIAIVSYIISAYNTLVAAKKNISRNWSNIDVSLKQRHDELTKLIDTCKQYMKYEEPTLQAIVKARELSQTAANNNDVKAVGISETQLRSGIVALNARAEAYPDLKANTNFQQLMASIDKLESSIADHRETYNDSVNTNNTLIEQFPKNIIAGICKFKEADLLVFNKAETADINLDDMFSK